jgi:hypothetical protein
MTSPADIITYIGVPLAVLGVSPILYNFIIAFFIKLRLKRQLKAVGLLKDTIIRSRLINGIVELELPVYDLELVGCPNVRPRFRMKARIDKNAEAVQGGTWTEFAYADRDEMEPYLQRYLAGRVTKGFQISTKLSLPEASVRFEDVLEYFLQNEWKDSVELEPEGFKTLKFQNVNIPVNTKLLTGFTTPPVSELVLKTARSSLENRSFLCLRLDIIRDSSERSESPSDLAKDDDYFSQLEIKKGGTVATGSWKHIRLGAHVAPHMGQDLDRPGNEPLLHRRAIYSGT